MGVRVSVAARRREHLVRVRGRVRGRVRVRVMVRVRVAAVSTHDACISEPPQVCEK